MKLISIGIAQLNFTVGDIDGNVKKILLAINNARDLHSCEIVVFPELSVTGYPPEDLLLRSDFLDKVDDSLTFLTEQIEGIYAVIGHPIRAENVLFNAASVINNKTIQAQYFKRELPNFGVFDEKRYFTPGNKPCVVQMGNFRVGLTICEDVWHDNPVRECVESGSELILNLNASPYDISKAKEREELIVGRQAKLHSIPIIYTNLVGGQDELVFDGRSFVCDSKGQIIHRSPCFREDITSININEQFSVITESSCQSLEGSEVVYQALCTGLNDYVKKNNFTGAVLGLSGGIDSALTLAVAVDSLGKENVTALLMPSRFNREISLCDAKEQSEVLGIDYRIISIDPLMDAYEMQWKPLFKGMSRDITEENIQARIRGNLLMAFSNKTGCIVLTTGNKSEMAVGYSTLYGDMAGGFCVLKDVSKTLVYDLAKYRNRYETVIPERALTRQPSAELSHNQADSDSLPDYKILDPILEYFIEQDLSVSEIIDKGFEANTVRYIVQKVLQNEYKRRQAPPGVRITRKAFGRDRRYPISSGYRFQDIHSWDN